MVLYLQRYQSLCPGEFSVEGSGFDKLSSRQLSRYAFGDKTGVEGMATGRKAMVRALSPLKLW